MWLWFVLTLVFLLLAISIMGYRRQSISRTVSRESIEDVEVVRAYDRISRWPQFRFLRRIIVGELRKHHPEGVLVDVGCGPGYLIATMARAFPHLGIVGVDIAEEMLQMAAKNLSSPDLAEKVSFRQGDIRELPLDDNSVDFVVSTLSLHHWSEPKQSLQEIHRVLKPSGQFLIFDVRRDSRRMLYWLIRFAQTFILPSALRRINEPTGSFLAGYTPADLETLLSMTPFKQWRIQPGFGWVFVWGGKG